MSGLNKVIILGNLGQDPEVKVTQGGQQVCTISVATSEKWTKDGKTEERTEWHRIVLWAKLAELAGKYLKKGRRVLIEGKLQTRSWDDQNGQKRYSTEIVATNMVFVDSASSSDSPTRGGGSGGSDSYYGGSAPVDHGPSDSDVPF